MNFLKLRQSKGAIYELTKVLLIWNVSVLAEVSTMSSKIY